MKVPSQPPTFILPDNCPGKNDNVEADTPDNIEACFNCTIPKCVYDLPSGRHSIAKLLREVQPI